MKESSYKEILKENQFVKMMVANVISRFGDSIDVIAFSWLVYAITGSPAWIAIIFGCNSIPNIIFQPFAGVMVERFSKKWVMVLCDISRGSMVAITAVLYIIGILNPWMLLGITFINSTLEAFRTPAGIAIVPKILPEDLYSHGMALRTTLERISEVIGLASAGGVIAILGIQAAMFIDAVTFLISAVFIGWIRYVENVKRTDRISLSTFKHELSEGFNYLRDKRLVFWICIFGSLIGFVFIPINSFGVVYIQDILMLGPEGLSAFSLAIVIGLGIGSFSTPKVKARIGGRHLMGIGGMLSGIDFLLLIAISYFQDSTMVYLSMMTIMLLFGISAGFIQVIINVAFMTHIEEQYMARVGSLFNAMAMSITPIGSLFFAVLASIMSISHIFVLSGFIAIALFSSVYFIQEFQTL